MTEDVQQVRCFICTIQKWLSLNANNIKTIKEQQFQYFIPHIFLIYAFKEMFKKSQNTKKIGLYRNK